MRIPLTAGGLLIGLFLGANALAGTIEGHVVLAPADLSFRGGMRSNAYVGQLSGGGDHSGSMVPSDTTYGVAYLADSSAVGSPSPEPVLLDQRGQRFIPRILAVVVGQAVEFRNSDNVFHNVFSYSPPKRFDLGRYPRGKSKKLIFQKPGLIQVFCDIHSDMRADIVVVPNGRFAYVDAEGRFRIDGVPPGKHPIAVWLPRSGERRIEVDVPERGVSDVELAAP